MEEEVDVGRHCHMNERRERHTSSLKTRFNGCADIRQKVREREHDGYPV